MKTKKKKTNRASLLHRFTAYSPESWLLVAAAAVVVYAGGDVGRAASATQTEAPIICSLKQLCQSQNRHFVRRKGLSNE